MDKNDKETYGLNERQLQFCEYYVRNGSAGLSYKKAYGDNQGKELAMGSCYTNGSRLLKNDKVKNYLTVLKQEATKQRMMEASDIISSLENIATDVGEKTSDKLRALELLGKYHALWQDKVNVSNDMQIEINLTGVEAEQQPLIIEAEQEQLEEPANKKAGNE